MRTDNICNKDLYIEIYEEWAGMGTSNLTDSINFRINLGRFNLESEYSKYECKQDSLIIINYTKDELTGKKKILETMRFSIEGLKKEGKFDK